MGGRRGGQDRYLAGETPPSGEEMQEGQRSEDYPDLKKKKKFQKWNLP